MLLDMLTVAIALIALTPVAYAVLRAVANDGYGHNPPPRSHRDEVAVSQHEKLRRLAR